MKLLNLLTVLIVLFTTSCTKEEITPREVTSKLSASGELVSVDATRKNLLFEETFNGGKLSDLFKDQLYASDALTFPLVNGSKLARFKIIEAGSAIRTEILPKELYSTKELWLGERMKIVQLDKDSHFRILIQFHGTSDSPTEDGRNPPIALWVDNGKLKFSVRWATAAINKSGDYSGEQSYDLGAVPIGQTLDIVMHLKFSHTSTGIAEVWINGVKRVSRINQPNTFNDQKSPWFKTGVYARSWDKANKQVVVEIDDVRIGNANARYEDVAPSKGTVQPPVEPENPPVDNGSNLITGISLMNSITDLAIDSINGKTIKQSANLNLRVDTNTKGTAGKMIYKVSGAETFTKTETVAPYAVFGDTNGDYKAWTPKLGKYTLACTLYDTAGKVIATRTLSFTVVK